MRALRLAWRVLRQTVRDFLTDNLPRWAAAVAFYGLLSLFPLVLLGLMVVGAFAEPERLLPHITDLLGRLLPEGEELVEGVVQEALEASRPAGVFSLAAWLWSGSRVFSTLTLALNVAWDVDEHYHPVHRLAIELAFTVSVGVLFAVALLADVLSGVLWDLLGRPSHGSLLEGALRSLAPGLLLFVSLFLVYWLVPRDARHRRAALVGAAVATVALSLAGPLFLGYVGRFGDYGLIYGSLAGVIVLLLWAWVAACIVLFAGELTSHVQRMVFEGRDEAELEAAHRRRSPRGDR